MEDEVEEDNDQEIDFLGPSSESEESHVEKTEDLELNDDHQRDEKTIYQHIHQTEMPKNLETYNETEKSEQDSADKDHLPFVDSNENNIQEELSP